MSPLLFGDGGQGGRGQVLGQCVDLGEAFDPRPALRIRQRQVGVLGLAQAARLAHEAVPAEEARVSSLSAVLFNTAED